MATLTGTTRPTLGEAGNIIHDGRVVDFAETLSELNPILRHALILPATDAFSHYHVQQLSLPTVGWRKINAGVATSQGLTKPVNEPILICESVSDVDERLVDHSPEPERLRLSYGRRHIMAMMQEFEDKFFYGNNATNPEQPNGLFTRYNAPATQSNVTDNGDTGTGASASVAMIDWDEAQGVYLANSIDMPMGIDRVDHGRERITVSSNPLWVYTEQFKLSFALVVADDRGCQRIGSIDPVYAQTNDLDANNLIIARGNMLEGPAKACYANRDVWKQVTLLANAKSNAYFLAESAWGDGFVAHILDVPIYVAEGLVSTEDAI